MMRLLGRFLDLAVEAVAAGVPPERLADLDVYRRLLRLGEEIGEGEEGQLAALQEALERAFVPLIATPAESEAQPSVSEVVP
jgi:hypothetical protein